MCVKNGDVCVVSENQKGRERISAMGMPRAPTVRHEANPEVACHVDRELNREQRREGAVQRLELGHGLRPAGVVQLVGQLRLHDIAAEVLRYRPHKWLNVMLPDHENKKTCW
jgi:hypothetical protein